MQVSRWSSLNCCMAKFRRWKISHYLTRMKSFQVASQLSKMDCSIITREIAIRVRRISVVQLCRSYQREIM